MLSHHAVGHSCQADLIAEILDRVGRMLAESRLQIRYDEYRGSVKIEGQRLATGKNTILITCDGGDPDVDVMVDSNCCGV